MARTLSPRVEECSQGGVLISVLPKYEESTLERLLNLNAPHGLIHYAAASRRTVAVFAAKAAPGKIVPEGQEQEFLSPFPLELLALFSESEVDSDILESLKRWGIRTLGQLSALPEAELRSRLGQRGLKLQRLARGEETKPFEAYVEQPRFEEKRGLEWECDGLEPLSFVLNEMLEKLCERLDQRGWATDYIQVKLQLTEGSPYERSLRLAFPMHNPKVLLSLLRLKLQSDPPQACITGVQIRTQPVAPQVLQYSLLDADKPNPEKLSRTMARLTALLGEKALGSPVIPETHRPGAFHVEMFSPFGKKTHQFSSESSGRSPNRSKMLLRRIRPPLVTRIHTDQIVTCSGPWRSSGNWWNSEGDEMPVERVEAPWSRDEWDIEMVDGQICRVYWDHRTKKWFLEGVYD
jgi:protein ImuB